MIHHATAENAEEIARLLRSRGRIVINAPARSGKTTELIRYAEERYPNGRFAVYAHGKDHAYLTRLHWLIYNGLTWADVVAKRLLGQELDGQDVNPPQFLTPESAVWITFNPSTPTFCDCWEVFTEPQKKAILKRRLFIAAVQGEHHASSEED